MYVIFVLRFQHKYFLATSNFKFEYLSPALHWHFLQFNSDITYFNSQLLTIGVSFQHYNAEFNIRLLQHALSLHSCTLLQHLTSPPLKQIFLLLFIRYIKLFSLPLISNKYFTNFLAAYPRKVPPWCLFKKTFFIKFNTWTNLWNRVDVWRSSLNEKIRTYSRFLWQYKKKKNK